MARGHEKRLEVYDEGLLDRARCRNAPGAGGAIPLLLAAVCVLPVSLSRAQSGTPGDSPAPAASAAPKFGDAVVEPYDASATARVGDEPLSEDEAAQETGLVSGVEVQALRDEMRALREALDETHGLLEQAQAAGEEAAAIEERRHAETIVAKGNFYVGGTFGIDFRDRDNFETLLGAVDSRNRLATSVSLIAGRMLIEGSLGVGLVLRYQQSRAEGTVELGGSAAPEERHAAEYELVGGPAMRGYVSLGGPLYLYYQVSLTAGYTESVARAFAENTSTVTSSNGLALGLSLQPGLMIAATDKFAIEVGVNVLGLNYQHLIVTTDYSDKGRVDEVSVDFDVDLLSLNFAFVGYF